MRPGLALLLTVGLLTGIAIPTHAQASCQFVLGFATLRDLIGTSQVGQCLENQRFAPNGNAEQRTVGGLMVWRKADNWTAFTNGHQTWLNGPNGVQSRLNTDRFDWERDVATTLFCPGLTKTMVLDPPQPGSTTYWATVTFQNTCAYPVDLEVNVIGFSAVSVAQPKSRTVAASATSWVHDVQPSQSASVRVRLVTAERGVWATYLTVETPSSERQSICPEVRTAGRCLRVDTKLARSVLELGRYEATESLLIDAANAQVRIVRGLTPIGTLGFYSPETNTVTIDSRLDAYSAYTRAAVVAHELTHAQQRNQGGWPRTTQECFLAEEKAFRNEALFWAEVWGNVLPASVDSVHEQLNDIALSVARDPVAFAIDLTRKYTKQCT